jgi:hypothetical protein
MGLPPFVYTHPAQWVTEGAPWQPPDVITLRDEAGTVISSTAMTTLVLTLYDVKTQAIVNGVAAVDVKNTRGCTLSPGGVFLLKLGSTDTAMLNPVHGYEVRRALVQYQWAAGAKSDAVEITFVVRNLLHRP